MFAFPSDTSQGLAMWVGRELEARHALQIGRRAPEPVISLSALRRGVLYVFVIFENYLGRLWVPKQERALYRAVMGSETHFPGLW